MVSIFQRLLVGSLVWTKEYTINMVGLLSLPEEILTGVYILAGQQTEALVQLSCVNRRLRDVWLKDSDHIIKSAIRLLAPDHEEAIETTLLENRLPKHITGFHFFDSSKPYPPLRLHLSNLWRNILRARGGVT